MRGNLLACLLLAAVAGCATVRPEPPADGPPPVESGAAPEPRTSAEPEPEAPYAGAFSITVENDSFLGTDNNYTNGVALSWATDRISRHGEETFVKGWADFWSFLPFYMDPGSRNWASWSLGQEMHTSDDPHDEDPPEDDQPYSGILYLDSGFHSRNGRWAHLWNVRVGVVGPLSGAEQTQEFVHKAINTIVPHGWDTQLPNEPIFNLDFSTAHLLHQSDLGGSAAWRIVPLAGASLGTYATGLSAGLYGEVGWNLAPAFGGCSLRRGLSTASIVGAGPQEDWSFSVFGGVAGFAVAYYLPLDGTVFHDSRSVDSEPLVGNVTFGVSLRHGRFALSFSQSHFTETFETQRERDEFGTITFSWYF